MEKRVVAKWLALFFIFAALLVGLIFLRYANLTGFAVFQQTQQSDFDLGTYSNTSYNGSAVVLSSGNLTGIYTSKVFDAGNEALWNSLTWSGSQPNIEYIFAVDNQADVWKSLDSGATWSLVKDDYNGADGNGVTASFFDSLKNYFIVYNQDIWISQDSGSTWTKVKDNYNGAEGQNAFVSIADKNNYIYIIEGDQDVWKSTDSGLTWTKATTDFNGGNGNFGGLVVNSSNVLIAVDLAADVWISKNEGATWSLVKDDYNGAAGNNADGMAIDFNNILYILDLQDVWKSTDSGVTWTKINDDFNGAGDAELGKSIATDSNNYIYIIDGGEDVFKSTDSGSTFNKIATNFNGANGITPTMAAIIRNTNLTLQVRNCSSSDCSDGIWSSVNLNNINLIGRYFQYKVYFTTPDTSATPTLTSASLDYDLINTAPTITLVKPSEGETYGYNTSISLNFSVSDIDNNIDKCWYNIDSANNITLTNCQNTTFNTSEGSHTIYVYVNDSQGEQANASVSFSINIGAPTISLTSPINVYLNYHDITFRYTPSDVDLASCELWGNFQGEFKLNQTNDSPNNGIENTFSLTLEDNSYIWNIKCNDSQGHAAFEGNKTFTVDTINPSLILTQPSGSKSSRTVTAQWLVSDANLDVCLYNVYRSSNIEIANTSVACSENSASFSVTLDADFTFNFYVNDRAGNKNTSSLSFTVSTSSGGGAITPSEGAGSSNEGALFVPFSGAKLELLEIGDVVVSPGESKTLSVRVKNIGGIFLNKCKLIDSEHISSKDIKGLSKGQQEDFVFVLNVPEDFSEDKTLEIEIQCEEVAESIEFNMILAKNILEIELVSSEQKGGKLNFVYLVREKTGASQEINAGFWLENSDGVKVSESGESFSLKANEELQKDGSLDLPNDVGEYVFHISLDSDRGEISLSEPVLIGQSTGLVGRVILVAGGGKILGIAVFAVLIIFVIIHVVRRIVRKPLKEERAGYVKVKLEKGKEQLR